ncbi:N-acetyltransferase [Deinococcus radiomollis]|uniref:GNAT family N-acetyltransferase n=1 Tax=Deinococcus radiomollis TaxID=468916 RepID=UPI0038911BBD
MSNFTLRPFTEADRPALLGLADRFVTFGLPTRYDAEKVLGARTRELSKLLISGPDHAVLVAEDERGLAGFVEVRAERDASSAEPQAYLASIAVAREAEGQGLGRILMAAAEAWARARGLPTLTLHVFATNDRARGFYHSLGFQEDTLFLTKSLQEAP